jgi:hypothetical protein
MLVKSNEILRNAMEKHLEPRFNVGALKRFKTEL